MSCADTKGHYGDDIESIERRKKMHLEEVAEMDQEIERLKAEEEQKRDLDLRGLYNRMNALIQTSDSSFSDTSMGEVTEMDFGRLRAAESYMRTIDIEMSGRYIDTDDQVYYVNNLDSLKKTSRGCDPTLVVSFLIPFDLIEDDKFFNQK